MFYIIRSKINDNIKDHIFKFNGTVHTDAGRDISRNNIIRGNIRVGENHIEANSDYIAVLLNTIVDFCEWDGRSYSVFETE